METIRVGEEGGVAVQISHHKASSRSAWGLVNESLAVIDRGARARRRRHCRPVPVHRGQHEPARGLAELRGGYGRHRARPSGRTSCVVSAPKHREWEGVSLAALGGDVRHRAARSRAPHRRRRGVRRGRDHALDARGRRAHGHGASHHDDRLRRHPDIRRQAPPAAVRHVRARPRALRPRYAAVAIGRGDTSHDRDARGEVRARRTRRDRTRRRAPTSCCSIPRRSTTSRRTTSRAGTPPGSTACG